MSGIVVARLIVRGYADQQRRSTFMANSKVSSSAGQNRPRVPPRERFAGTERVFNLEKAFADLPAESTARQGHMQKALYRLGPTTTAIFAFDSGGAIEQHTAEGESIIHVLSGRLSIRTSKATHELGANDLMLLDPGVPYDLTALEPTRMLMTFVLGE
jgi:quercetin dioxygenase-like cupin family protein